MRRLAGIPTRYVVAAAVLAVAAGAGGILARRGNGGAGYEFVQIERGTIENVISATGTLQPVGTVEVGTQVSGTIQAIFVDFNDHVRKGQVLAVLDTTFLAAGVRDAQAGVRRARALYEQALADFQRDEELFRNHFVTETQYLASKTAKETAHAALLSAQAAFDRAAANLRYAVITSPIDGTVIQRNYEPGRTVAASLSAPTLFLIAEDLAHMEILGLVDEGDIGEIWVGMPVRFTVEAWPDRTFHGTVKQIRLQPTTVQNVVTYTVVIDAPNPERLLLPGMTATIDFIVERIPDTLLVSNRALRFEPTEEMLRAVRKAQEKRMAHLPDSLKARFAERMRHRDFPGDAFRDVTSEVARLWLVDEKGRLTMIPVRRGPTDGSKTVIAPLRRPGPPWAGGAEAIPALREGLSVISGVKGRSSGSGRKSNAAFGGPFGGPPPR